MKKILLILIAALLAWQYPAKSQTVREEGQSIGAGGFGTGSLPSASVPLWVGGRTSDSTSTTLRFDADGNLQVVEGSPLTSYIVRRQNWKTGVLVAGNRDSTDAQLVLGAGRINLYLYGRPDSVSAACLVGLRIIAHFAAGTSDTLTAAGWNRKGNVAGAATVDSIGNFIGAFANTGTVADSVSQYGEIPWVVEGYRSPAATLKNRNFPPMVMFPLVDRNGAPLVCERISVRIRPYKFYDGTNYSAGTSTNRYVYYTIHLEAVR